MEEKEKIVEDKKSRLGQQEGIDSTLKTHQSPTIITGTLIEVTIPVENIFFILSFMQLCIELLSRI